MHVSRLLLFFLCCTKKVRHKLGHACEIASHAGRRLSLLMGGARKKDRLTASPAGKDVTGARCWKRIAWPEPLGAMRRREVQTCRRPEIAPSASHARGPSSHSRAPRRRCAKRLDVRTIVSAGDGIAIWAEPARWRSGNSHLRAANGSLSIVLGVPSCRRTAAVGKHEATVSPTVRGHWRLDIFDPVSNTQPQVLAAVRCRVEGCEAGLVGPGAL